MINAMERFTPPFTIHICELNQMIQYAGYKFLTNIKLGLR